MRQHSHSYNKIVFIITAFCDMLLYWMIFDTASEIVIVHCIDYKLTMPSVPSLKKSNCSSLIRSIYFCDPKYYTKVFDMKQNEIILCWGYKGRAETYYFGNVISTA